MATVVKMPKWGLTMTAGTVTDWLYEEGAEVSEGDPIFTVETEKAVNDVEAPADGVLLKIVASQGEEVPVSGPVMKSRGASGDSGSSSRLREVYKIRAASEAPPRKFSSHLRGIRYSSVLPVVRSILRRGCII